jgi:hypothetical protein
VGKKLFGASAGDGHKNAGPVGAKVIRGGTLIHQNSSVYFRDILTLPFNAQSGIVNLNDALVHAADMPKEVVQQVFVEHGRKAEFQSQYGHLDLNSIRWNKESIAGVGLAESSHFEGFYRWYNVVGKRASLVATEGWSCIDRRQTVVEHWKKHLTWITPPVLIDGALVNRPSRFHLMEGHTRVGLLAGLIEVGIIDGLITHEVWVGRKHE